MSVVIVVSALWLLTLALWVALKLRQPKWSYPSPSEVRHEQHRRAA